MTMSAADPLVTDLIDPVTFSDESGDYTRIYAYDLETGLSSKEVNSENRACRLGYASFSYAVDSMLIGSVRNQRSCPR
jgi:hypothetical protein